MPNKDFIQGRDYYLENGFIIFTEQYLKDKGFCCGNKCRHCPYVASIKGLTTLKEDEDKKESD